VEERKDYQRVGEKGEEQVIKYLTGLTTQKRRGEDRLGKGKSRG
jgi:hypothetical protein